MGRYRFKDKFLNFWFFYVYKNYNYLEIGETQSVLKEIELNFNDRFVSFAFEEYVLEKILQNPKKILGFTPCKIGRWWNKNEEIDIVAYDEQNIAFIECKWQNSVNREFELNRLIKKSTHLNHNLKESCFIFTKDDFLRSTV